MKSTYKNKINKTQNINNIMKSIYKKSKSKITKKTIKIKENKTQKNKKICNLPNNIKNLKYYNSNYLENEICKFIPLFEFNPNIKKNIVSACFFKMRKGGYKNFNRYLNGINILYDVINETLPNFSLRLFIDMSIYNDKTIMNILYKLKKIEIVLFCCKLYERENIYHLGTFGTMLRAFPLFDFPNNDSNRVIIVDIDVTEDKKHNTLVGYTNLIKYYTDEELDKLYIFGYGKPYMVLNNNKKYIIDNKYIKPYFIIDKIIGFKKIPKKIIIEFLYNIQKTKEIYSTYHINKNDKTKKCDEYICFGIDEYLINEIVIPYLLIKKYSLLFLVNCNLQSTIYNFNKELYSNLKSKFYSYINLLTKNIDKKTHNIDTIEKSIDFINDIFYKNSSVIPQSDITEIHKIILKNYYDLFYTIYKNKDFTIFNKDTLDIILSKNMIGYFKKVKYVNYNNNLKQILIKTNSIKIDMTSEEIKHYNGIVDKNRKNINF